MSSEDPIDDLDEYDPEDTNEGDGALIPFYTVGGDLQNGATVQAGYLNDEGEVAYLVIDMQGLGVNRVPQAFEVAYGWYTDELNAIAGQQQAAEEQAADETEGVETR